MLCDVRWPILDTRMLRNQSEVRRMIEVSDHCEEWIGSDFQRIFSSYAKHSACLPGAIMENIVCMQRWLLGGKVVGAMNTAEMMVKLLALSGTCLEDTRWPFHKADVEYNFVRLMLNWKEANVDCQAMNRFGQQIQPEGCPSELNENALRRLLWKPSPLRWQGRQVSCTFDFAPACVVHGMVTVPAGPTVPEELETCSETGRNRRAIASRTSLDELWSKEKEQERATIGFVLNLPETGGNVWHNFHWIVPAVSRLHGSGPAAALQGFRVPADVLLIFLFDGYNFEEEKLDPGSEDRPDKKQREEAEVKLQQRLEEWVVRHAMFLKLLTSSPPVLLHKIRQRCFGR